MSRVGESRKDAIKAKCEVYGIEQVENHLKNKTGFKGADEGYAKEWLEEQKNKSDLQRQNEELLKIAKLDSETARRASNIAFYSAVASALSALAAIVALFLK